ncbi:MAG: Phosphopantetheine adenylyltransferase [Candidatus Eremiobacteraeota bacterium]|jgi:pantetheine-phosphate adenylyltransferase|nr:Phosphopantetheine adenylyltransferase [Candidatus Eremiobacteraeota bacterium]
MNGTTAHSAIYPGSFDPMTRGHLDVIQRASAIFDKVVVAVVVNPQKRDPLFSLDEREEMIRKACADLENVEVTHFRGLLANFVQRVGATVIVKGLRVVSDFEGEMSTALMNRSLSGVDTVFLPSDPRWSFVSSTLVKEVFNLGADVAKYVPPAVLQVMQSKRPAPRPAET